MTTAHTGRNYFECRICGYRVATTTPMGACPDCGGRIKNIGVPQE